jgi:hypothetical protein
MCPIGSFRAVHCAGVLIADLRAVTALSMLFDRVFLPGNIELITEFAKTHRFSPGIKEQLQTNMARNLKIHSADGVRINLRSTEAPDEFDALSPEQRETAEDYALYYLLFLMRYRELIGDVLETDIVGEAKELQVTVNPSETNKRSFSVSPSLTFASSENSTVSKLLDSGYVPVAVDVGNLRRPTKPTAREVATLLAMRSVQMVFPAFGIAEPADILEARERLRDHLPPFWAAMLRLSTELAKRINESMPTNEMLREADEIVDTIVRPSAIELKKKIEKERTSWMKRILGPTSETLKLLFGRPGLTQHDLLTAAMLLGVNATSSALEQARTVDSLRNDSGLTYLLELEKLVDV